jgi:gamma-glutamyltranspeptidase/glutathione hydrolase
MAPIRRADCHKTHTPHVCCPLTLDFRIAFHRKEMTIMRILRKPGVSSTMRRWAVPASAILFFAVFLGFYTSGFSSFELPAALVRIREMRHETLGAVASAGDICSRIGTSTIQRGGNAVDAALATDFCLGVTHSWIAGLGGGGYAIIRDSTGRTECVDFRETAPAASDRDMYNTNPNASTVGGLASGVPGELRGLEYIHKRYGKLSWESIIQPALEVARDGFTINTLLYNAMTHAIKDNGGDNFFVSNADWAKIFAPNGTMLGIGDTVLMEDYANLLESVAINGANAFYTGPIAAKIASQIQASGGILTTKDLEAYVVKASAPLEITYGAYKIKACHATSGGSIVLSTMNTFQQFAGRDERQNMNVSLHRLVEAMRFGYAMVS